MQDHTSVGMPHLIDSQHSMPPPGFVLKLEIDANPMGSRALTLNEVRRGLAIKSPLPHASAFFRGRLGVKTYSTIGRGNYSPGSGFQGRS